MPKSDKSETIAVPAETNSSPAETITTASETIAAAPEKTEKPAEPKHKRRKTQKDPREYADGTLVCRHDCLLSTTGPTYAKAHAVPQREFKVGDLCHVHDECFAQAKKSPCFELHEP